GTVPRTGCHTWAPTLNSSRSGPQDALDFQRMIKPVHRIAYTVENGVELLKDGVLELLDFFKYGGYRNTHRLYACLLKKTECDDLTRSSFECIRRGPFALLQAQLSHATRSDPEPS